jgi:hypothetical protein
MPKLEGDRVAPAAVGFGFIQRELDRIRTAIALREEHQARSAKRDYGRLAKLSVGR